MWNSWWSVPNVKRVSRLIEADHVDFKNDYQPLQEGRHYFRLWLVEMFLREQVHIFQTWYPAVHALVRFDFAGKPIEVPTIADSTKVAMKQQGGRGDVIAGEFPLTSFIPFNSGVIEINAGLIAVQGENYLNNFIKVLSDFSGLLAVPQLSTALDVAQPLANGLQALFSAGGLHLGWHGAFAAAKQGGYFAVVRASEAEVPPQQLWVVKNQLRKGTGLADGQHVPFEDFDHMLFRLEVIEQRGGWDELTSLKEPMNKAYRALADSDEEKAEAYRRAALVAANEAPELTTVDVGRVKREINKAYTDWKNEFVSSGLVGEEFSLEQVMKRAMSVDLALELGDPTFEELLAI
jgi:hypothetical protein